MADDDKHLEPSRWQEFLEHQFIMNTERDAVELDKILEQEKKHASDGAWHHRPKDSRARYNVLAFATFCFFILFLSGFIVACVTLANTPLKGEKFRISLLQLSNGSVPGPFFNLSAVLLDAGMSDSGCTTAVAGMKNVGANVEVTYESTVHPDAWHLELAPDFEWQEHSMEFEVAVLRNDGTVRQTVLHPVQCGWGTSKRWTVNQQGNNWDGRRTTLELPEVWWESVFGILVEFAFGAVGCAIASILAMRNEARLAWRTLRVMTAGILATVLILALAETISEGWRHSFYWWRAVYGSSVLLFFLAPDARSMFDAALMLVGLGDALLLAIDFFVLGSCAHASVSRLQPILTLFLFIAGVTGFLRHRYTVARLQKELVQDQATMEEAWLAVTRRLDREELSTLQVTLKRIRKMLPPGHPQQAVPCLVETRLEDFLDSRTHGAESVYTTEPVESLDQLYAQASAVQILLHEKVLDLAVLHAGYLRSRGTGHGTPSQLVCMSDVDEGACDGIDQDKNVEWAELKPSSRALSKVLARYNGDASQLLDVCRELLAFPSVASIADCLRTLASDPDVKVVRIKNNMVSGTGDENKIAGLRFVLVNLKFVSAEAEALAINGHVCELMLTLTGLAAIMTPEAHHRHQRLRAEEEDRSVKRLIGRCVWMGVRRLVPRLVQNEETWQDGGGFTAFWGGAFQDRYSHDDHTCSQPSEERDRHTEAGEHQGSASVRGSASLRTSVQRASAGRAPSRRSVRGSRASRGTALSEICVAKSDQSSDGGPSASQRPSVPSSLRRAGSPQLRGTARSESAEERERAKASERERVQLKHRTAPDGSESTETAMLVWDRGGQVGAAWQKRVSKTLKQLQLQHHAASHDAASPPKGGNALEMVGEGSPTGLQDTETTSSGNTGGDWHDAVVVPSAGAGEAVLEACSLGEEVGSEAMEERRGLAASNAQENTAVRSGHAVVSETQVVQDIGTPGDANAGDEIVRGWGLERTVSVDAKAKERFEMLRTQFCMAARQAPGQLDRLAAQPESAYATAGTLSVLVSEHLLASCLCKKWSRYVVLLIACLYSFLALNGFTTFYRAGRHSVRCVRFTFEELRGQAPVSTSSEPFIAELGLLHSHCRQQLGELWPEPARTYEFEAGVDEDAWELDGFYFRTSSNPALDPVVFTLEGSAECDGVWHRLGASRRFVAADGHQSWHAEPFATPDQRNSNVDIDLKHTWHFWVEFASRHVLSVATTFAVFVVAVLRKPHRGMDVVLVTQLMRFFVRGVAVVGAIWDQEFREGRFPHQWSHVVWIVVITALLWHSEQNLPVVAILIGVWDVSYAYLEDAYLNRDEDRLKHKIFKWGYLFLAIGAALCFTIHRTKRRAVELIRADQERYRALWTEACATDRAAAALQDLQKMVEDAKHRLPLNPGQKRWELNRAVRVPGSTESMPENLNDTAHGNSGSSELHRAVSSSQSLGMHAEARNSLPRLSSSETPGSRGQGQPTSDPLGPAFDTAYCAGVGTPLGPRSQSPGRPRSPPYRHGASSDWSTSAWMETPMGGSQARRMSDGNVSRGGSVLPVTRALMKDGNIERQSGRFGRSIGSLIGNDRDAMRSRLKDVTSVDQLYVQAAGLHPVLIRKVKEWALVSRGKFKVEQPEPAATQWFFPRNSHSAATNGAVDADGVEVHASVTLRQSADSWARRSAANVSNLRRQATLLERTRTCSAAGSSESGASSLERPQSSFERDETHRRCRSAFRELRVQVESAHEQDHEHEHEHEPGTPAAEPEPDSRHGSGASQCKRAASAPDRDSSIRSRADSTTLPKPSAVGRIGLIRGEQLGDFPFLTGSFPGPRGKTLSGTGNFLRSSTVKMLQRASSFLRLGSTSGDSGVQRLDSAAEKKTAFMRMDELPEQSGERGAPHVMFAGLKKHDRAVEKLIRAYRGKVSSLCDICRQSIYFDEVEDLVEAMRTILQDDEVAVKSIKNRLSPDYDDTKTAGYRDVNITLCIQNEDTHSLMVDLHICEVQLILTEFAKIKTDAGHRRYVEYRNMRAA